MGATIDLAFSGYTADSTDPLTSVIGVSLWQGLLESAWLVSPYHGVSRVSSAGFHWYDMQGKRNM